MTKTRSDLAQRALQRLGVVAAGQAASAEDMAIALAQVDPLYAELVSRDVMAGVDMDAIPDEYFLPIADRLAAELGPDFGIQNVDVASTEARLRRMFAGDYHSPVLRTNYF